MCLFPINAEPCPDGGTPRLDKEGSLKLPCGKCRECISKRAVEWATRARHEISEHTENSFITLTYNEQSLPSRLITDDIKNDWRKFMKRLRKKLNQKISYMVSYEYGSQHFRPHMHALIFGWSPSNLQYWSTTQSGSKIYRSDELEKLWTYGYSSIGEANEKTAYYIASYALKGKERDIFHPETGEELTVRDEMSCSKRPAIGLEYFLKNAEQVVNSGDIIPRYYVKNLEDRERHTKLIEKYPQHSDKIKKFPDLVLEYEENLQRQIKNRSDHEKFAKFKIDLAKSDLNSTAFRATDLTDREKQKIAIYESQLKTERDNYVSITNKEN